MSTAEIPNTLNWYGTSTGSSNAYAVSLPVLASLPDGLILHMKANFANTGAATLQVSSLAAKNIKRLDGSNLRSGDIPQNGVAHLVYDGTNFQLLSVSGANTGMEDQMDAVLSNVFSSLESQSATVRMERGWFDSFAAANQTGADEANSTSEQHDSSAKLYKGSDGATGAAANVDFATESQYIQQEWTKTTQATNGATVTNGQTSCATSANGTGPNVFPSNCNGARISFDGGSTWYDVSSGQGTTALTLASSFTGTSGTYDYIIRMTEFNAGAVQLNSGSGGGSESLDQDTQISSGGGAFGETSSYYYSAQTFTAGMTGSLTKVKIYLKKTGSPSNNAQFWITATSGGYPTGSAISSVESITPGSLTTSYVQTAITFSTPASVTSGTVYAVVMTMNAVDSSNYYQCHQNNTSGYSGGKAVKATSTPSWSDVVDGTYDNSLETYVTSGGGGNVTSEYVSVAQAYANGLDSTLWADINSAAKTETLNSQNAWYWLALDPASSFGAGSEVKIWNATGSVWRKIARNNSGTWQYNNDSTNTAAESWSNSTVSDMLHAVSQAVSAQAANRMTGAGLAGISDANWEASGGWSTSVNKICFGVTLQSASSSQNPSVDNVSLNYDSTRAAMDLRSKTHDPGFVPAQVCLWALAEHSAADGAGTFYVTRDGGTAWTAVTMTQKALPDSSNANIRILRGLLTFTTEPSGQDVRCRYVTAAGKEQYLHAWGLQARPA